MEREGGLRALSIDAVVFDLDGVLLDSEGLWDRARREVASAHGGRAEFERADGRTIFRIVLPCPAS